MGRVKEVLVELDNKAEAIVTNRGLTIGTLHLTMNDIEQTMRVIQYLREVRPFETLEDITHDTFPHLASLDTTALPTLPTPAIPTEPTIVGPRRK